ncbi:MAG: ATP-binding protein [Saprospiraceae bacterium]|nr:ATP-binding protein [Saprospiraceae bacterium]
MIHEFKVSNFLSFREEQTLSFEATSDKTFEDLYCVKKKANLRLLKMGMIYGANASGKSNVLKAIDYLRTFVLSGRKDKTMSINPPIFAFDPQYASKPTQFHLSFFIGETRYIYKLELTKEVVLYEKLEFYPGTQPAKIFERTYAEKEDIAVIEFGDKSKSGLDSKDRAIFESHIIRNISVIGAYTGVNISSPPLDEVLDWFKNRLAGIINPTADLVPRTTDLLSRNDQFKDFVLEQLRKADYNVGDIIVKDRPLLDKEKNAIDRISPFLLGGSFASTKADIQVSLNHLLKEIFFSHYTSRGKFELPFESQSEGTKRYYGLSSVMYQLFEENTIAVIDEIESSLHFDLINYFIRSFLVNSKSSQLLFTTHNIQILAEDFLRRDVIWFTEKQDDGSTVLFSYPEVRLHKNISPYNAYKIGKIGAKPELGSIYTD